MWWSWGWGLGDGKQTTDLDTEGKASFSRIKKVEMYWTYYMSGTVECISDSLHKLNIKTLWDTFYCSNACNLWEMRHNFPNWKMSQTFIVILSVPFIGLLGEDLCMRNHLTQKRISGCFSDGDIMVNMEPNEICEERFYQDLQDILELTPKKDALFITGD